MTTFQRVRLVADSTHNMPQEWLDRLGIISVPCYINFGQESFPDDGVAMPSSEFYRRLATSTTLPSTSAMPIGTAMEAYRRQLEHCEHLVVLTLATQFSSIYNTMKLAAEQLAPDRITMYDSGSVSVGLGWQMVYAAEAAASGADAATVIQAAREARQRIRLNAVIDTLEYLKRGGRVNAMVAGVGTLLQIKPIIDVGDGEVRTAQRVRTFSRGREALLALVRRHMPIERLAIIYTQNEQIAHDFKRDLGADAPADTVIVEATSAIGVHVGPGCVGVGLVRAQA